uniref:Ion transport domain-containing protein n=1 Tax=Panagrolaimus superbus TaxID=310955 RepID=A0A914YYD4_9BILA
MGVQLFGRLEYHCVLPETDPNNVTILDLAIPDTMCSKEGLGGYQCPGNTNVFIAVITETFAEIRVQFSEMWQKREVVDDDGFQQKLEKTDNGWKLITVDSELQNSTTPSMLHQIVRSTSFTTTMMIIVLLNAMFNASFVYYHDESDIVRRKFYYYTEIVFTFVFIVETIVKIIALSWGTYIRRGQHKIELILCLGSTLNVIPFLYATNVFTYFQVFRLIRLIKASPMLEDFVYKIFGPGKKLGSLVLFTMLILIITSAVSLQLFCFVPHLHMFRTFPQAFMCMFQIITEEGWTEIVVEILRATNYSKFIVSLVAAYFVGYHLLVTLIVLSLFVAVILDNLEMDEELKKVKQLKAREETTCMRTTLPWRLRIFEKFPTRPQMVTLRKINNDFPVPKVRDSFTRQFADTSSENIFEINNDSGPRKRILRLRQKAKNDDRHLYVRQAGQLSSRSCLRELIDNSNKNRILLFDSNQFIAQKSRSRRDNATHAKPRNLNAKIMYEHLKENGDLRLTDSAPKNNLKEGEIDIKALQQKRAQAEFTRNRKEEEMRENHPFFDRPLFTIGRDSNFRRLCQGIVYAKYTLDKVDPLTGKSIQIKYKQLYSAIGMMPYLDWTMVLITAFSCCSMLLESPWPTTGENLVFNNPYLQICEYIFVFAMTLELLFKVAANGLFFTTHAVVRDIGGVMTIFIYITSVWYLIWMPKHVEINSFAQILMIFRAMRPLRIYTLVPQIRRVVVELCKGFKEILLVTILLILLVFTFASFGVQIVGGKLAACNDYSIKSKENCTGVFEQPLLFTRMDVYGKNTPEMHPKILVQRVWANPQNFNFDHVGNAMLALFETLSYKGWNVMRDLLWMRQGAWSVIFLHVYVFMGCMIGLTLFVGVIVANYMENRGTALLTVDQRRWHDLKARLRMAQPLHIPPKPSESAKIRNYLYELTMSKSFKQFYSVLVVIISGTLVIPWNVDEERAQGDVLFYATLMAACCNILFTVEVVLKIIAFTFHGFWQSKRNRIDLFITILGIAWIFLHFIMDKSAGLVVANTPLRRFTYTFGYTIVTSRFFTITGRKSTLKMLMTTVLMSMLRSFFIISAMFLLVLFYAYTGVILFAMVKYGHTISKHVNFRTSKEALVVLFRCVTGEDWNDIMHAIGAVNPPFCFWREGMNYWETDCGNYYGAVIYFCSFYLIITYIVLNVLVAIIMENFSLFYSSEEDALLSYADIRNFQLVWNMVDTSQKGYIPVCRVKFLLRLLKGRLEVDPTKDKLLFKHMCYEMERLHNSEDVSFHDILSMLSYRSVDIRKSLQLEELLQREELEYIIEEEKQMTEKDLIQQLRNNQLASGTISNPRTSITDVMGLQFTETSITNPLILNRSDQHDIKADIINEERSGTKKSKNRRSSIPDIMGEAKKLMWGTRIKTIPAQSSTPDRPAVNPKDILHDKALFAKRTDKRGTMKQFQMATCDLPDLDEFAEEEEELLANERRLSLDNCNVYREHLSSPGATMLRSIYSESTTNEIQHWWEEIFVDN